MAMLAERKRKQKWTLNPRGNDWSDDSNKFGQKMLERMGWSSGKGLGVNLNGMTEHVKVSYKNDSRGMGFKESNDQWTQHEDQFSNLLQSLSNSDQPVELIKPKIKSLEEKSQKSRARVHYHKFTRGKDLSRYSEKDLANIFGRKELKKQKKDENENTKLSSDSDENKSSHLIESGSMADYFKKKIPNFGVQNGLRVGKNGVLEKAESESEDERPSFGFGFQQNNNEEKPNNSFDFSKKGLFAGFMKATEDIVEETPKKKKKRKSEDSFVSYVQEVEVDEPKIKKKKKKKSVQTEEENVVENVYEVKPKKKKSKKKPKENDCGIANGCFEDLNVTNEETTEVPIVENPFEVKPKKSKKKRKSEEAGLDNNCFDESNTSILEESIENPYEIKPPKKKKSKKNKENNIGLDNPALNLEDSLICDDLMLNITDVEPVYNTPTRPILLTPKKSSIKRRKSVRFSNVNQEHIIPNNEDNKLAELMQLPPVGFVNTGFDATSIDSGFYKPSLEKKSKKSGISNIGFNNVQENVELIEEQIDTYQAEVENDLNEAKIVNNEEILVGESGASKESAAVKGGVRLSFNDAKFSKNYVDYFKGEKSGAPKKSYKHLIKGDIVLTFNNANLHELTGYATKKRTRETLV